MRGQGPTRFVDVGCFVVTVFRGDSVSWCQYLELALQWVAPAVCDPALKVRKASSYIDRLAACATV